MLYKLQVHTLQPETLLSAIYFNLGRNFVHSIIQIVHFLLSWMKK